MTQPTRHGSIWTEDETNELFREVKERCSIEDMAQYHHRTETAITAKLESIAVRMILNGDKTMQEIRELTNLKPEQITMAIQREQLKQVKKREELSEKDSTLCDLVATVDKLIVSHRELNEKIDRILNFLKVKVEHVSDEEYPR